jgi:hypothetical protein
LKKLCALEGCVTTWGDHVPHCGARRIVARDLPCVLPRGHSRPGFHVYGTPGSLEELFQRHRSVVVTIVPV